MAPADDNSSTPGQRDIQALYIEYQKTTDLVRRQQLLSEIYAGYLDGARDDIWLLLCDAFALSVSCCRAPEAAERLLLETAHEGGFPHCRWHQSNESLRGASPQHRGIDPRLWGKSVGYVRYRVDWENSAVAYVRQEVSPYSPEGVALERLGDFLPAEPYFQINLVRLPLRDVLTMLYRAGLLPDASSFKPPPGPTSAPASKAEDPPAQSAALAKVTQQKWWGAYLTPQTKARLAAEYKNITEASHGIRSLMAEDRTIDGGAYQPRYIEKLLREARIFPPVKRM